MYEKPPDGCENAVTPQVYGSESLGGAQDHVFLSCSQVMLLLRVGGSTLKSTAFQHGTPSSGTSTSLLEGIPRGFSIHISALAK